MYRTKAFPQVTPRSSRKASTLPRQAMQQVTRCVYKMPGPAQIGSPCQHSKTHQPPFALVLVPTAPSLICVDRLHSLALPSFDIQLPQCLTTRTRSTAPTMSTALAIMTSVGLSQCKSVRKHTNVSSSSRLLPRVIWPSVLVTRHCWVL